MRSAGRRPRFQQHLMALVTRWKDFEAALALFEYSGVLMATQPQSPTARWARQWQFIAGREGALTIYHLGKIIENIGANFPRCPTVLNLIDRDALRTARRRMDELFPKFVALRHAVAHAAELMRDAETTKANAVTGPIEIAPGFIIGEGMKVFISSGLINREFTCTIDGEAQSYEIGRSTLDGLTEVRIEIYTAFLPVELKRELRPQARRIL